MSHQTRALCAAAAFLLSSAASAPAFAKDDLLETLAQKGVISMEEYEKLKAGQPKSAAPTFNTEDALKLASADGAFSIQLGTLQQIDYYAYDTDGTDIPDGAELRRSRLSVGGTLFKDFSYRVEYEFSKTPTATGNGSSQITDAYVAYMALKPFIITVGQFKPAFSMEALTADKSATFMERGLPFYLITPLTVRTPGVQLGSSGDFWSATAGFSGSPLGDSSSGDEGWGYSARGTLAPQLGDGKVVHAGVGYTWRRPTQDNASTTAGTPPVTSTFDSVSFSAKPESDQAAAMVSTGNLLDTKSYQLIGTELAAAFGPASIQGEYDWVKVSRDNGRDDLDFKSFYAQIAYTLTGEARPYKTDKGVFDGIKPAHPFGKDGWGAWEVAARISQIDLTDGSVTGGKLQDMTLGLSWYLNSFMRVSANYVDVLKLDRAGNALDDQKPAAYQMRVQLAF
jgi:phosphate-selective porin OprO/OprP